MLGFLAFTVTSSAIVFERGANEEPKAVSQEDSSTPADPSADPSAAAGGGGGAKKERKQWGVGEGAPLVAMLQEKTLRTATYAATTQSEQTQCSQ